MKTIKACKGVAFKLKKNKRLRVIDPNGRQVSDLFCVNALDPQEYLSSGRSIDYADKIFLTKGDILYSNRSFEMLRIIEDNCGRHDFLLTPCSLRMFQIISKSNNWHPSCHENLAINLAKFEIPADRISTTFNIFMNVTVAPDGRIEILAPLSKPGSSILFEAQMDLIVGLTACSHEETNAGICKSIQYEII